MVVGGGGVVVGGGDVTRNNNKRCICINVVTQLQVQSALHAGVYQIYWQMKVSIFFIIRCQSTWITTTNMHGIGSQYNASVHAMAKGLANFYPHDCKLNDGMV